MAFKLIRSVITGDWFGLGGNGGFTTGVILFTTAEDIIWGVILNWIRSGTVSSDTFSFTTADTLLPVGLLLAGLLPAGLLPAGLLPAGLLPAGTVCLGAYNTIYKYSTVVNLTVH